MEMAEWLATYGAKILSFLWKIENWLKPGYNQLKKIHSAYQR